MERREFAEATETLVIFIVLYLHLIDSTYINILTIITHFYVFFLHKFLTQIHSYRMFTTIAALKCGTRI